MPNPKRPRHKPICENDCDLSTGEEAKPEPSAKAKAGHLGGIMLLGNKL